MSFGAEVRDDGDVRFRLWAPGTTPVDLCLEARSVKAILPMAAEPEGWFGLAMDRYRTIARVRGSRK